VYSPRQRLETSTPELDRAEALWWERYAEVEEQFCWVQPPRIREALRAHYVRKIARSIPPGGRALEIGCGTGWLSLFLAAESASDVHGLDFSAEQIKRAREAANKMVLAGQVRFHHAPNTDQALSELRKFAPFDLVVIHGVLHHLSRNELRDLLRSLRALAPEASLIVVEPVWRGDLPPCRWTRFAERIINYLVLLPRMGQRSGLRRTTEQEEQTRALVDSRGDSPKETPFRAGELERLAANDVNFTCATPVLLFSYLAAKNLLLMKLSYPGLVSLLLLPYLRFVRAVERLVLARTEGPFQLPVFVMFEGHLREAPATSTGVSQSPTVSQMHPV
jgi:SAM-dependent methyltransferase